MMEAPALKTEENAERQPWHKPEIQNLAVSLDTGIGAGSVVDADGFEFSTPSDRRLKQDIAGFDSALEKLLVRRNAAQQAQLIPVLVEAIKEQQRMLSQLQGEIEAIRRESAG